MSFPALYFGPSVAEAPVRFLDCSNMPAINSIPLAVPRLDGFDMPAIQSIPSATLRLDCSNMPVLSLILSELVAARRLQRWFRTGEKQTFKRFIRTRAFNEWIFSPDQIGGKLVKRHMEAELSAMRP